jgi:hypothetical protein
MFSILAIWIAWPPASSRVLRMKRTSSQLCTKRRQRSPMSTAPVLEVVDVPLGRHRQVDLHAPGEEQFFRCPSFAVLHAPFQLRFAELAQDVDGDGRRRENAAARFDCLTGALWRPCAFPSRPPLKFAVPAAHSFQNNELAFSDVLAIRSIAVRISGPFVSNA